MHELGRPIAAVYFPLVGVVSFVADLGADLLVETTTIGREGMAGIALFLAVDGCLTYTRGTITEPRAHAGPHLHLLRGDPPRHRHCLDTAVIAWMSEVTHQAALLGGRWHPVDRDVDV